MHIITYTYYLTCSLPDIFIHYYECVTIIYSLEIARYVIEGRREWIVAYCILVSISRLCISCVFA